jgi:hypothetical protein
MSDPIVAMTKDISLPTFKSVNMSGSQRVLLSEAKT